MKNYYLRITKLSYDQLLQKLKVSIAKGRKEFVITANGEIFVEGKDNEEINNILLDKRNIITPDGISIVKTARWLGIDIRETLTGIDLCIDLLNYAESNKKTKVFIYGTKQIVLTLLKEKYPNINFVGLKNGYDNDPILIEKEILKLRPDIIIVALGVPKQELFINHLFHNSSKGIFIGCGGAIDVISGYKKRAPKFFLKHHLEWLYRICIEPRRIKRFIKYNIRLLFIFKK